MKPGKKNRTKIEPVIDDPSSVSFEEFLDAWNHTQNLTTPDLHKRFAHWLVEHMGSPRRHLQAFRFSGKSFITSCYVAWRLFRNPNATFIIISATQKLATRNASFIRSVLENHPWTEHLVPQGEAELWQRTSFTVNRPATLLEASVQALALTGDFTGAHAEGGDNGELIADDIETSENSRTAEGREYVSERIQEFKALCPSATFLGTFHAGKRSIYIPMIEDPEIPTLLVPIYEGEAPEDGQPDRRKFAWPERFGAAKVAELFKGNTNAYNESQYLCRPSDMNVGGLDLEFAHTYPDEIVRTQSSQWFESEVRVAANIGPHQLVDVLAAWDPASGKKDDSVLAIVAKSKDDNTFLHRVIKLPRTNHEGWKPQVDAIIAAMKQFGITKVHVETNTNPTLPAELKMAAERAQYRIRVLPVHNTLQKELRVRLALEASITNGRFFMHSSVLESEFPKQAADFPANMKGKAPNDYIDAAAFGVLHLRKLPPGVSIHGMNDYRTGTSSVAYQRGRVGGDPMARTRQRSG